MSEPPRRLVVDWSSAAWAGLLAATLFLALNLTWNASALGLDAAIVLRMNASIALGEGVLPPPATLDAGIAVVGVAVHYAVSVALALLLALVIHRFGLIVGFVGGAAFGLVVYAVNVFALTLLWPWMYQLAGPAFLAIHVLFGAVAGGVYELLEVEEFELVEDAEEATP